MGRVWVEVKITNDADRIRAEDGIMDWSDVRQTTATFLVDTGAALLSLTPEMIEELGLRQIDEVPVITANGKVSRRRFGPVGFEVNGRAGQSQALETHPDAPLLLGYIPLEMVDLQVNPKAGKLQGDPLHNYEWMYDAF